MPQLVGRTIPSRAPPIRRYGDPVPEDYYNSACSHDKPGVIALLGLMVRHGIESERVKQFLNDLMDRLLAKPLPVSAPAVFADFDGPDASS